MLLNHALVKASARPRTAGSAASATPSSRHGTPPRRNVVPVMTATSAGIVLTSLNFQSARGGSAAATPSRGNNTAVAIGNRNMCPPSCATAARLVLPLGRLPPQEEKTLGTADGAVRVGVDPPPALDLAAVRGQPPLVVNGVVVLL